MSGSRQAGIYPKQDQNTQTYKADAPSLTEGLGSASGGCETGHTWLAVSCFLLEFGETAALL